MDIAQLMLTPLQFKVRGSMRNLHPTTMPLWSLLKGIQENAALATLTAQGREILEKMGKQDFQDWKPKNLMAVYIGCRFKDVSKKADLDNVGGYTGLAGFDFDNVEAPYEVLAKLWHDVPHVICAGLSASGRGVWCAAHVAAATDGEYRATFARGVQVFTDTGLGPYIDKGAHDPTRARFASSCPEAWWRYDGGDIPAFQPDGDLAVLQSVKASKKAKVKMPEAYTLSPELAFDEVRQVLASAATVEDGDRNNEKARQCGQLKTIAAKAGVPPSVYAPLFVETWDKQGSTHKKTVSIATRLLMGGKKRK